MEHLIQKAATHVQEIISLSLKHTGKTLVVYDTESEFARIMTEGYRKALPDALFVDIAGYNKDTMMAEFEKLSPGDLVVLVQSNNFRLDDFRIRIFLFRLELKTIEHVHLERMREEEWERYIDALHYNPEYYHRLGNAVKSALKAATTTQVFCGDHVLTCHVPFEEPMLNIGDYSETKNIGGTFPIGEVFTEATDLSQVEGSALVYGFAGMDHGVVTFEPFPVYVRNGVLSIDETVPVEFREIIELIEATEPATVREFGFGMNPAIRREGKLLRDITACERVVGLHLSLGGKHSMYKKPGFGRKDGRYHIDIFVASDKIVCGETTVFENGEYVV